MTGFVYAIENDAGHVKIGWSGDPLRRVAEVRTYSPMGAKLLGLTQATPAQETEIHRLLASWRLHGEWFRHTGPVAAFVAMLGKPVPRPVPEPEPMSIKALRTSLGENQATFAKRIGVDQTTLSRWETRGIPDRGLARVAVKRLLDECGGVAE